MALALWPQYARETLPPQIYTAVADHLVREQQEEQEDRATEWEQSHPRPPPKDCPELLAGQTIREDCTLLTTT